MFDIKDISNTCFIIIGGILITVFLPNNILLLTDHLIIRFILIAWIIWGLYNYSYIELLLLMVFVALLFAERNRVKIENARDKFEKIIQSDTPAQMTVEEAIPQSTVPVVPFDEPPSQDDIYTFMPTGFAGTNTFDGGMTTKHPLPTVLLGEKMAGIYKAEGLALGKNSGSDHKNLCSINS